MINPVASQRECPYNPVSIQASRPGQVAGTLHDTGCENSTNTGGEEMGYILAWLLGVPATLLILIFLITHS